jgi:predicted nucleotidyltransferase component of viral defense system
VPSRQCDEAIYGGPRLTKRVTNISASVGQKLRNLARQRGQDFASTLTKFALERVLFRLSISKYRDAFVLKGALLFELWTQELYRTTRDADFLAMGDNTPARFMIIFQDLCNTVGVEDGLRFDAETVKVERINEGANYKGVRVLFIGYLEDARIPIQIDLGFGDVVTPLPEDTEFPALLDLPGPKLLVYPRESVVAEKFETMVKLGIANSRMKDFYDLWRLLRDFRFDGPLLSEALRNTFTRRRTELPNDKVPLALTEEFYGDRIKIKQWKGFCEKNRRYIGHLALEDVCLAIKAFLMPVVEALVKNDSFHGRWPAAGPWEE